ncbi:hypothetical protein [Streptomyces kronopolitis]
MTQEPLPGGIAGEIAARLRELLGYYPVGPPWSEPAATLTLTGLGGDSHVVELVPGAGAVLSDLVRAQIMTCRAENVDGSARCMHCDGSGRQHPTMPA